MCPAPGAAPPSDAAARTARDNAACGRGTRSIGCSRHRTSRGQHGKHVTGDELVPALVGTVEAQGVAGVLDQLRSRFDPDHVGSARLKSRKGPSAVVAGDVEHPGTFDDVQVVLDQSLVAHVQSSYANGRVARLEKLGVLVEPPAGPPARWHRPWRALRPLRLSPADPLPTDCIPVGRAPWDAGAEAPILPAPNRSTTTTCSNKGGECALPCVQAAGRPIPRRYRGARACPQAAPADRLPNGESHAHPLSRDALDRPAAGSRLLRQPLLHRTRIRKPTLSVTSSGRTPTGTPRRATAGPTSAGFGCTAFASAGPARPSTSLCSSRRSIGACSRTTCT